MTSTIKVNNIQNQCGQNIINENSNTITLGASGDTIALASGASQTGFGRTGTVDWDTTKKTATFTAANGEGYFVDTSGGAVTMNLPSSPSAGNIVAVKDYSGTFQTNNLTIGRGGSPINGAAGADVKIDTQGASIVLVYVDGTQGWVATQDDSSIFSGEAFITATGGTISTCGDFKIHTFTGPGTFCVSQVSSTAANNKVDYLVVAGGGGGGATNCTSGGAGGAGGFRYYANTTNNPQSGNPAAPINNFPSGTEITITATGFPIAVGAAGAAGTYPGPTLGGNGGVSTFSTVTSAGGGGGHGYTGGQPLNGSSGGSGGGGSYSGTGGTGNTPPVSPAQGFDGGNGDNSPQLGGGGGGALAQGADASSSQNGCGGVGAGVTGFGTSGESSGGKFYFAGGGGGGADAEPKEGTGGLGGGGDGKFAGTGTAGATNTGGGGGGSQSSPPSPRPGGAGGSGIVIIRYKFQ